MCFCHTMPYIPEYGEVQGRWRWYHFPLKLKTITLAIIIPAAIRKTAALAHLINPREDVEYKKELAYGINI